MQPVSYAMYNVTSLAAAKTAILSSFDGRTTTERWELETPWIVKVIKHFFDGTHFLDFGCGIGRISRQLLHHNAASDYAVVGLDSSQAMLNLAQEYVADPRFFPRLADANSLFMPNNFDGAWAIWVLQHVLNPESEIARIAHWLKPNGKFLVINENTRCVPLADGQWLDDLVNIKDLLSKYFLMDDIVLPISCFGKKLAQQAFAVMCYKK